MRRRTLTIAAAAAVIAAVSSSFAGSAHARALPGDVLVRADSHRPLPLHGGTVDSLNWSGYAVTGSGISGVSGTFVVPSAGLAPPGFAATWAGIGGYSSSDLIQAGVSEDSLPATRSSARSTTRGTSCCPPPRPRSADATRTPTAPSARVRT